MIKGISLRLFATDRSGPAFKSYSKRIRGANTAMRGMNRTNKSFMKGMNANRRIVQQVGMQVSDLGVQIAGGQSAILSLTQNVPQVVQMFGAWGGVLAAIITLVGTFTLVMIKSGKGFQDIAPYLGITIDEFNEIARVVGNVKNTLIDFANVLVNNIDVMLISVSLFAGYMATKWVASMIAGGRAVGFLVGSLNLLKAALIKTGIGAIIVALAYAIERFIMLTKATGSFSEALVLAKEVAKQTFMDAIPAYFMYVLSRFNRMDAKMSAGFLEFTAGMVDSMASAANRTVQKIMALTKGGLAALSGFVASAAALARGDIASAKAIGSNIGTAVTAAFNEAVNTQYLGKDGGIVDKMMGSAAQYRKKAEDLKIVGDELLAGARNAIPAWREVKSLIASIEGPQFDVRDWFGGEKINEDGKKASDDFNKWLDKMSKSVSDTRAKMDAEAARIAKGRHDAFLDWAQSLVDNSRKMNEAAERTRLQWRDSFQDMFRGLITGATSLKDTVINVLNSIANKLADMALNNVFDSIFKPGGGSGGGIGGFLSGLFGGGSGGGSGSFITSFLSSFNGGGFTGRGARSGGVDGKGGFPAILHPNETVIDHTKVKNASPIATGYNGGSEAPVTIYAEYQFNGVTREETRQDIVEANKSLYNKINTERPGKMSKIRFNQRRGIAS